MTIEMDKEQVLKDLATLKGQFAHVHKYYNLSDKEVAKDNFDTIIKDLTEYLKQKLWKIL